MSCRGSCPCEKTYSENISAEAGASAEQSITCPGQVYVKILIESQIFLPFLFRTDYILYYVPIIYIKSQVLLKKIGA